MNKTIFVLTAAPEERDLIEPFLKVIETTLTRQKETVLIWNAYSDFSITTDDISFDLLEWSTCFKGLSPGLIRNAILPVHRLSVRGELSSAILDPESLQTILEQVTSVFDWVFILWPMERRKDNETIVILDHAKKIIDLRKQSTAENPWSTICQQRLTALHFPWSLYEPLLATHPAGILDRLHQLRYSGANSSGEQVEQQLKRSAAPALDALVNREGKLLSTSQATATIEHVLAEHIPESLSHQEREVAFHHVLQDLLGLGPLEPLLRDPDISEIMVNGPRTIYVEKRGKLYISASSFETVEQLRHIIDRIVAPTGRRVDESMPLCDARLSDGSRVNVILPPLSLDGPILTIRKFITQRLQLEDLIPLGTMDRPMADFLQQIVHDRRNIVVSGGTGSGKTTLLNALSSLIPDGERIVTIEDAAELQLQKPHVVRLESRPANAEGQGAISIRRLVTNALRMRPDRIVVGECRGGETLDMLQAMNTGHDGSLTTVHANSGRDALSRLETLALMADIALPISVVRDYVARAVDVLIHQSRFADGTRRVTSILQITGLEQDRILTQELFRYHQGQFEKTGVWST